MFKIDEIVRLKLKPDSLYVISNVEGNGVVSIKSFDGYPKSHFKVREDILEIDKVYYRRLKIKKIVNNIYTKQV